MFVKRHLLLLLPFLCLTVTLSAQDSLYLELQYHFTTQQGYEEETPNIQLTEYPYLYAEEKPDNGVGVVQSYDVYRYDDIPIEGTPVWEGIQDWKLEDNPSSKNQEYISFRSFRIGADLWFAFYLAEDAESGSGKSFGRLYIKREPGTGGNDSEYPKYELLDDEEYLAYQTSEGVPPPGIFDNGGYKWILSNLDIVPLSSSRPDEVNNLISDNTEEINDGDPATFLGANIGPENLEFVNGDTVVVAARSFAAAFDISIYSQPRLIAQIEYANFKSISILGEGDNYIYYRAQEKEAPYENKILMVRKGTLEIVNESDLNFSYDYVRITSTEGTFEENVIEKPRDVLTFFDLNYDGSSVYKFREQASFSNSSIDSLSLIAKGSELIPWTFGYAEKLHFDPQGRMLVSMTFDKGDVYPVGYARYSLVQTPRTAVSNEYSHPEQPASIQLDQNYPNPFNPATSISFTMPESAFTRLAVYNALGEKVATLVEGNKSAGTHTVNFDASSLSSGVYFYVLESDRFRVSRKMMLIK